jgi:hypothetical protein
MTLIRTLSLAATAGALVLLAGCASPHRHGDGSGPGAGPGGMQGGMHGAAMQDMRQKMAAAKTPEERQALMTEHMKAMHEGMGMMHGMRTDPAWREQMQSQCAEMMKSMNTPPVAK